jgi:hypothetical protein
MVQTGVTTETLAETVEQGQKTPMTTLEVVPEPELTGTMSEMLGICCATGEDNGEKRG